MNVIRRQKEPTESGARLIENSIRSALELAGVFALPRSRKIGDAMRTNMRFERVGVLAAREAFSEKSGVNLGLGEVRGVRMIIMKKRGRDPDSIRNSRLLYGCCDHVIPLLDKLVKPKMVKPIIIRIEEMSRGSTNKKPLRRSGRALLFAPKRVCLDGQS